MMLNLNHHQAQLLNEVLTRHLERLKHEIVHTDHRDFRDALKRTALDLEELQRHLSMRAAEEAVYG